MNISKEEIKGWGACHEGLIWLDNHGGILTTDVWHKIPNHNWKVWIVTKVGIEYLPQMMTDDDWPVRATVASRIGIEYLPQMMADNNSNVREEGEKNETKQTKIS